MRACKRTAHAHRSSVVALALGIAEMVKFPIVRVVAPPLSAVLGPELKHWVPTIITTVINFLGA